MSDTLYIVALANLIIANVWGAQGNLFGFFAFVLLSLVIFYVSYTVSVDEREAKEHLAIENYIRSQTCVCAQQPTTKRRKSPSRRRS